MFLSIYFVKLTSIISYCIWNIIKIFRWNKKIDIKEVETIIFNRQDRIWDAVITKPLIILFKKFITEKLGLNIKILIQCSQLNEFVFKNWDYKKYYEVEVCKRDLWKECAKNTFQFLLWHIKDFFKSLFSYSKISNIKKNQKIIFVDMLNSYDLCIKSIKKYNCYCIWENLWVKNYIYDYSLSTRNINLIQMYIDLIKWCFNLPEFEWYVNRNINIFYSDYNYNNKKWILIFVWTKKYRNFNIETWINFIKHFSNYYSQEYIYILDDDSNNIYSQLKNIKFNNNVFCVKNSFTLDQLKEYAKQFKLIIWMDWWWFNYMRTCTDSIDIFTLWNHRIRSLFTWNYKYKEEAIWNWWFINKVNIQDKNFWFVYKKSPILHFYDFDIQKDYFNAFSKIEIDKLKF